MVENDNFFFFYEKQIQQFLFSLKNKSYWQLNLQNIYSGGSLLPHLYGLPKAYKIKDKEKHFINSWFIQILSC